MTGVDKTIVGVVVYNGSSKLKRELAKMMRLFLSEMRCKVMRKVDGASVGTTNG